MPNDETSSRTERFTVVIRELYSVTIQSAVSLFRVIADPKTPRQRLIFVSSVVVIATVVYAISPERERLWGPSKIDTVVVAGIASMLSLGVMWIVAAMMLQPTGQGALHNEGSLRAAGALAIILTLFVGYASFRNQSRLSSEAGLFESGYRIYDLEMANPVLRCLYFNYGHSQPTKCLERIVANEDTWSLAIFYVEESWFQLIQANKERDEWGATYAQQIRYWALDVGRDATGLFSYYLLSSAPSLADVQKTMADADVSIKAPCLKYRAVWRALQRRSKQPTRVSGAARECGHLKPVDSTILAAGTLPIEDD